MRLSIAGMLILYAVMCLQPIPAREKGGEKRVLDRESYYAVHT